MFETGIFAEYRRSFAHEDVTRNSGKKFIMELFCIDRSQGQFTPTSDQLRIKAHPNGAIIRVVADHSSYIIPHSLLVPVLAPHLIFGSTFFEFFFLTEWDWKIETERPKSICLRT
jgi:hypothetical protein